MVPLMILNGVLRERVYAPRLQELRAHQLSTLTGVLIVGVFTWLVFPWLRVDDPGSAAQLGLCWLALTVAFEFLFGRFVAGHTWKRLLQDYDLRAGRVWTLFLTWIALAPWVVFELRA
ncbi:MAG: hypothetical protein DWQ36_08250 [Acidobacteria bacterium]|nr:MAG: hypothetical protein DWQ30_01975 [Acidobacteriota bacterium]REK08799.1 MAG: hypothetical protein DWQ36_08250 [Acidobacteriota bacterium]